MTQARRIGALLSLTTLLAVGLALGVGQADGLADGNIVQDGFARTGIEREGDIPLPVCSNLSSSSSRAHG